MPCGSPAVTRCNRGNSPSHCCYCFRTPFLRSGLALYFTRLRVCISNLIRVAMVHCAESSRFDSADMFKRKMLRMGTFFTGQPRVTLGSEGADYPPAYITVHIHPSLTPMAATPIIPCVPCLLLYPRTTSLRPGASLHRLILVGFEVLSGADSVVK